VKTVKHDVDNLHRVTKSDIVSFFDTFVSPTSPQTRSKLAVHLLAQNTVLDVASQTADNVNDVAAELSNLFVQVLQPMGLTVDKEALAGKLESVDVKSGDSPGILSTVVDYLSSTGAAEKEKIDTFARQGHVIIDSLLPSLGIVPKKKGLKAGDEDSVTSSENKLLASKEGNDSQVVEITDVRDFKAGLPLSEGLKAVKDISEFEELEAKL